MAQRTFTAAEQSNAQVVYMTGLYDLYQNKTDIWADLEKVPDDEINYRGLTVPIELAPNASFGYRTGDGDAMPVPQAPNWSRFTVNYVGMQMGTNETYAALLNANKRTTANFRDVAKSNARQFAFMLNAYASMGNGTQKLATVSTNYSGGTPTIAVSNGAADSLGPSLLIPDGYYQVYDATGATLRNGTIGGAGIVQLASKTAANAVGATNWPSDMVATDIIVPATATGQVASVGLYGLPIIFDSSGTYFGVSRASVDGLAGYEKAMGGNLTVGALQETYASISQRGGYFGSDELIDQLWIYMNQGNWNNYLTLALNAGALAGSAVQFNHTSAGRPGADLGWKSPKLTYFGAPVKIGNSVEGSEIYFGNSKVLRRAVLKDIGKIGAGMPAADWLQAIDSSGNYQNARVNWWDFFGQIYSPQPFKLGKISGITLASPTQKATGVLMNG
jgi:hypothetical protein